MQEIYFNQYEIKHKTNLFRVVVFPQIEDVWLYDSYPAEETYDIDGSIEGMRYIIEAFALILEFPQLIVYLPVKKNGNTFNLVLTGKDIEGFKPSVWYKIKPFLKHNRRIEDLKLLYDEDELLEQCKKALGFRDYRYIEHDRSELIQKELGDTVFCSYGKQYMYCFCIGLIEAVKALELDPKQIMVGWGLGFVMNGETVEETRRRECDYRKD